MKDQENTSANKDTKEDVDVYTQLLNDVMAQKPIEMQIEIQDHYKLFPQTKPRSLLHLLMIEFQEYLNHSSPDVTHEEVFNWFTQII